MSIYDLCFEASLLPEHEQLSYDEAMQIRAALREAIQDKGGGGWPCHVDTVGKFFAFSGDEVAQIVEYAKILYSNKGGDAKFLPLLDLWNDPQKVIAVAKKIGISTAKQSDVTREAKTPAGTGERRFAAEVSRGRRTGRGDPSHFFHVGPEERQAMGLLKLYNQRCVGEEEDQRIGEIKEQFSAIRDRIEEAVEGNKTAERTGRGITKLLLEIVSLDLLKTIARPVVIDAEFWQGSGIRIDYKKNPAHGDAITKAAIPPLLAMVEGLAKNNTYLDNESKAALIAGIEAFGAAHPTPDGKKALPKEMLALRLLLKQNTPTDAKTIDITSPQCPPRHNNGRDRS